MDFIERSKREVRTLAENRGHTLTRWWHTALGQFAMKCRDCGRKVFMVPFYKYKPRRGSYYGLALEHDCEKSHHKPKGDPDK